MKICRTLPVALALFVAACTADRNDVSTRSLDHEGKVAQRLINGTADAKDPAVVLIVMRSSPTSRDVRVACTGTVVSPHIVLTAAHCVDPRVAGKGQYGVFVGDNINDDAQAADPKRFFTAKATHFDPVFDPANQPPEGGNDLGVVETAAALPVTPLPMNRAPLGMEVVGTKVRVLGAGLTSPDADVSGQLFEFSTLVTGVDAEHLLFDDPQRSLCNGDSGGPSLVMKDGREVIVGVHSFVSHATSCTGVGYDQRLDAHVASFVDPYIRAADPGFDVGANATAPDDAGAIAVEDAAAPPPAEAVPAEDKATTTAGCATGGARGEGGTLTLGVFALLALAARRRRCTRA